MKLAIPTLILTLLASGCALTKGTNVTEPDNEFDTGFIPISPMQFDDRHFDISLPAECYPYGRVHSAQAAGGAPPAAVKPIAAPPVAAKPIIAKPTPVKPAAGKTDSAMLKKRKECWLDMMPNSEDFVAIRDIQKSANAGYLNNTVSVKGNSYTITSHWARYLTAKALSEDGSVTNEEFKVGVGARIVANVTTKESGINLSDLFAVAVAAENSEATGTLLFTIQGIHGKGVDTYTPKISKLDTDSLKKALDAVQSIKTLLHNDDDIHLTGQVIAKRTLQVGNTEEDYSVQESSTGDAKQGWVYVGHFDESGRPLSPTNLVVDKKSDFAAGSTVRARFNLNVRAGYPTFPFYRNHHITGNVTASDDVQVKRVVEVGYGKSWALIEY